MNTQDSQYGSSYAAWIVHFREHIAMQVSKSNKLANVCYDIRGPVLKHAKRLEEEGHRILKLNIGNPAPFGFEAPDEILQDVIRNLPTAQGYSDSKGLFSARKAVMQYYQQKQVEGVGIEDIYLGNGVSELIVMSMQALLNNGDEVLVPAPDYPLWTAAVSLSGGNPVHYLCDEQANWWPDLADIKAKITPNTKATGDHQPEQPDGRGVFEGSVAGHAGTGPPAQPGGVLRRDLRQDPVRRCRAHLHRLAGAGPAVPDLQRPVQVLPRGRFPFRLDRHFRARNTTPRATSKASTCWPTCACVPTCRASTPSRPHSAATRASTTWCCRRAVCWSSATAPGSCSTTFPGVSCVKPMGALYAFPRIDPKVCPIHNDEKFVLDLLLSEKLLVVQGTAFNWPWPDHFRVVTLPRVDDLEMAIGRIGNFLKSYRQ